MRRLIAAVTVLLVTSQLAACQRGMDLQIVGTPLDPDFVLAGFQGQFGRGDQPAVDNLEVDQVSGSPHRVWAISRDPSCVPTYRFRYGTAPDGWTAWTTVQPLHAGETYVVSTSGCGFFGGRTFKILNGVIVSREGSGDEPIRAVEAMR